MTQLVDFEQLTEALAKVLNGPFEELPSTSKFTLEQLRETRWSMLSSGERAIKKMEAKAALRYLRKQKLMKDF